MLTYLLRLNSVEGQEKRAEARRQRHDGVRQESSSESSSEEESGSSDEETASPVPLPAAVRFGNGSSPGSFGAATPPGAGAAASPTAKAKAKHHHHRRRRRHKAGTGPRELASDHSTTTEESSSSEESEDYIHQYDIESMNDWYSMPSSLKSSRKGGSTALTLWDDDANRITLSEFHEVQRRERDAHRRAVMREQRRKRRWEMFQHRKRRDHWRITYMYVELLTEDPVQPRSLPSLVVVCSRSLVGLAFASGLATSLASRASSTLRSRTTQVP